MLTITPEALEYIRKEQRPLFLELPKLIQNCCFDLQECPTIRFGEPRDKRNYRESVIDGAMVFVPASIIDMKLTIVVQRFLGFKRLVVEGWSYC